MDFKEELFFDNLHSEEVEVPFFFVRNRIFRIHFLYILH